MKPQYILIALLLTTSKFITAQNMKTLSHTFELRYVTNDTKANGETDFKGPTQYLTTEQRVEYLKTWSDYATNFFHDKEIDQKAVTEEEVDEVMKKLKPQPLPEVRKAVRLEEWKWAASKDSEDNALISPRQNLLAILRNNGHIDFKCQSWRFRLEADIEGNGKISLNNGNDVACEYRNDGKHHHLVWEVDLQEDIRRYNLIIDNITAIDFKPLKTSDGGINRIVLSGDSIKLDNIWGVGYTKTEDKNRLNQPMFAHTFIDITSKQQPNTTGWTSPTYDDSKWETCTLPKNHGTERHEGENLLLRKWVALENIEKAYLEIESLFPSGELWINGKVVDVMKDSHKKWIDITKYLKPNTDNLFAIKIDAFKANFKQMMHHCPTDPNIGWFAGRTTLHLTKATRISDLYVYTKDIKGKDAKVTAEVTVTNTDYNFYKGKVRVFYK